MRGLGPSVTVSNITQYAAPEILGRCRVVVVNECYGSSVADHAVQHLKRRWAIHPVERASDRDKPKGSDAFGHIEGTAAPDIDHDSCPAAPAFSSASIPGSGSMAVTAIPALANGIASRPGPAPRSSTESPLANPTFSEIRSIRE